jgi:hypothetical protein
MATITYDWANPVSGFILNNNVTANNQLNAAIASDAARTRYFAAWDQVSGQFMGGRIISSDGTPVTPEFPPHFTDLNSRSDPSIAGLANGNFVVTYTDFSLGPDGDIFASLFEGNGVPVHVFVSFPVNTFPFASSDSDVAALADGGFVVTWTDDFGMGNSAARVHVFNADGSSRAGPLLIEPFTSIATALTSVAGLAGGGFVVAWLQQPAAGGNQELWFQRYDANGAALGGQELIIGFGSLNYDVQLVALLDGGFAAVYVHGDLDSSVEMRIFNSDGSQRNVVALANGDPGAENNPTVTLLSNGFIVVGWSKGPNFYQQAFTPQGDPAGDALMTDSATIEAELAGMSGGLVAVAGESLFSDGSGNSMGSEAWELFRRTTGDDSNETLTGDSLVDVINARGGDDIVAAGGGNAFLDGGAGNDTAIFDFRLVDATVTRLLDGFKIQAGATAVVVSRFESYVFADGTVNTNDGNPLVDDLFYYAQNRDVWNAHIDADAHYNATGWREGRDPNDFFDTSLYLAAYPDIAAAGLNPLTHYDTIGWKESRVPAPGFGTRQYLAANPDVAAAHVDPLWHFLAYGASEGRQAIASDRLIGANGFDWIHYLVTNPDVAAAGVDPFWHFQTTGWKEGRDPNALFDVSGYLARNPDVASAHINPLDHYNQFGWREGRDPSVDFDTTSYLAANPDVAAAKVNPLHHFLHIGQAEGRLAFADGVFD